jgi:hypothetical protein
MSLDIKVSQLSDSQLMDHMCQARAVFQYTTDGESYLEVECLTTPSRVWNTFRGEEAIVPKTHQYGVIGMALVLDSLKDSGVDSVSDACSSPSWMVSSEDINIWFPSTRRERSKEAQMAQLT